MPMSDEERKRLEKEAAKEAEEKLAEEQANAAAKKLQDTIDKMNERTKKLRGK